MQDTICMVMDRCAPSARELLEVQRMDAHAQPKAVNERVALLASRVEKVLALHQPFKLTGHYEMGQFCGHCSGETRAPWPCPTVRILNGEEA